MNDKLEEVVEELTKILIKQDMKDKEEGIEYIRIPKINLIKQNIRLIKFIQKNKNN